MQRKAPQLYTAWDNALGAHDASSPQIALADATGLAFFLVAGTLQDDTPGEVTSVQLEGRQLRRLARSESILVGQNPDEYMRLEWWWLDDEGVRAVLGPTSLAITTTGSGLVHIQHAIYAYVRQREPVAKSTVWPPKAVAESRAQQASDGAAAPRFYTPRDGLALGAVMLPGDKSPIVPEHGWVDQGAVSSADATLEVSSTGGHGADETPAWSADSDFNDWGVLAISVYPEEALPSWCQPLMDLLPPGRAWTRRLESTMYELMCAVGWELGRVEVRAQDLMREIIPSTAGELLAAWERATGLPDDCGSEAFGTPGRQSALARHLREDGDQSRDAYRDLILEELPGADVTIVARYTTPWRVGISAVGDPIAHDGWLSVWRIDSIALAADTAAAERARCLIQERAHIHTLLEVQYPQELHIQSLGTFTAPAGRTYWIEKGTRLVTAAENERRLEELDDGQGPQLAIEGAHTWLVPWSEDFSQWTVYASASLLDGRVTYGDLVLSELSDSDALMGQLGLVVSGLTAGENYTAFVHVEKGFSDALELRADTTGVGVQLDDTGAVAWRDDAAAGVTIGVQDIGPLWRLVLTFTAGSTSEDLRVIPKVSSSADGNTNSTPAGSVYAGGVQLVEGALTPSYVKGEGAAVTLAEEDLRIPNAHVPSWVRTEGFELTMWPGYSTELPFSSFGGGDNRHRFLAFDAGTSNFDLLQYQSDRFQVVEDSTQVVSSNFLEFPAWRRLRLQADPVAGTFAVFGADSGDGESGSTPFEFSESEGAIRIGGSLVGVASDYMGPFRISNLRRLS